MSDIGGLAVSPKWVRGSRASEIGKRVRQALPAGNTLSDESWLRRHRAILVLAWLHVPFVLFFAAARDVGAGHAAFEAAVVAIPLVAAFGHGRKLRSCGVTLSLLSASAVLVHLSSGSIEMHFHFFVMLAVISIYQDWTPFGLAIGFVLLHHGLMGSLDPHSVYNHAAALASPWKWAAIHALFVSGSCSVSVIAWKMNEASQAEARDYFKRLYDGERAMVHKLHQVQSIKEDLVSIISHELRTPVTSIVGFSDLLVENADRLSEAERDEYADSIRRNGDRLKRMVENICLVVNPVEDAPQGVDIGQAVEGVSAALADLATAKSMRFETSITPGLQGRISPDGIAVVLSNLMGNAVKYGREGTAISIRGEHCSVPESSNGRPAEIKIEVSNIGSPIPKADRERIFEPFVQLDSSTTRKADGLGLGLHIVRKLVRGAGGDVEVGEIEGGVVFAVKIPVALGLATLEVSSDEADMAGLVLSL